MLPIAKKVETDNKEAHNILCPPPFTGVYSTLHPSLICLNYGLSITSAVMLAMVHAAKMFLNQCVQTLQSLLSQWGTWLALSMASICAVVMAKHWERRGNTWPKGKEGRRGATVTCAAHSQFLKRGWEISSVMPVPLSLSLSICFPPPSCASFYATVLFLSIYLALIPFTFCSLCFVSRMSYPPRSFISSAG